MDLSFQNLDQLLPEYDARRAMLARDPLASVEGFRLSILLTLEYIFGMRVCPRCPNCNAHSEFKGTCTDLFGSNAYAEGGVFGRADGIFISIEAQKSAGGLHAHGQLHIQCIHQHKPLSEILTELAGPKAYLVQEYLRYKEHVCRQWYEDLDGWKARKSAREEAWPEYKSSLELVSKPKYSLDRVPNACR